MPSRASEHLPFTDAELETLLSGRRAVRRVQFDPFAREIGIRLLSDHEIDLAQLDAQRYCKKVGADVEMDPAFLEREKERQIIWRAIVEPDEPHRQLFPSDSDVRMKLDAALVRNLFLAYLEVVDELNPILKLTSEEVASLAEQLGKGREAPLAALRLYGADTLRSLVLSMASQLSART